MTLRVAQARRYSTTYACLGQYYQSESGLNQNINRDYDPLAGSYVQSDPIGLRAGNSTYGYSGGNPASGSDPTGLFVAIVGHTAAWPLGYLTHPRSGHLALLLEPDDPCHCNNVPAEETIGAQPVSGKLVKKYNYPSDSPYKADFTQLVDPPPGMSDCQFINALINAAARYDSSLPYSLPHNPSGYMGQGEYNSNSFVSGTLQSVGAVPPAINTGGLPFQFPGYQNPIPLPH